MFSLKKLKPIDRPFLITSIILIVAGFFIFLSASLGLTARNPALFQALVLKQLLVGVIGGGIAAYILSRIKYTYLRKIGFLVFIFSLILTCLVFIPGIGFEAGGAKRWILIGSFSFQPAELLKIGFILYIAAWLTSIHKHVTRFKIGLIPLIIIYGITGVIMLAQPDTDTLIVMLTAGFVMFFSAGARWRDIALIILIGIIGLAGLVTMRPYIKDRLATFINPASDPLNSSYQIQQSLIAIGSGGVAGRGFGQSLQKFNFLPEPTSDSIFAVAAEEFGFIGGFLIIVIFFFFALRGYRIASRAPDTFGSLLVIGFVTMVVVQSFMNIASMLGVIPLSGLPLLFVSHGGTALFFTLVATGIIMNVSRYQKN